MSLLLHRDQKVGQAADLAHAGRRRTNSRDQPQTDSQTRNLIPPMTEEGRQSQNRMNTYSHSKWSLSGWAGESFLRHTQHTHVGAA